MFIYRTTIVAAVSHVKAAFLITDESEAGQTGGGASADPEARPWIHAGGFAFPPCLLLEELVEVR